MRHALAAALLASCLAACAGLGREPAPEWLPVEREVSLEGCVCYRSGEFYLAEQPSERVLETLQRRGLAAVLDLRSVQVGLDDPLRRTARDLGLDYLLIVTDAEGFPSDAVVDRFLGALSAQEGRSILTFCERGTTSALLFTIYRAASLGMDVEQAILDGLKIGIKAGEAEVFVRAQVARRRAQG